MKTRALPAILLCFGLLSASVVFASGESVTVTGKVLGHVVAGDDDRLYELLPTPKAEALMDLSGRRVRMTGVVVNDCDWTCLMDLSDFSDLSDQTPPPPPVFAPGRARTEKPAGVEAAPIAPAPVPPQPQKAEAPAPPVKPEPEAIAAPTKPEPEKAVTAAQAAPEIAPQSPQAAEPEPAKAAAPEIPAVDPSKFRAR